MLVGRQDIKGIHISRTLGAQDYAEVWDSIHVPKDLKESLLCQALLNFTLRAKVSRTVIPLHGIILLVGEPGTGKTSLARGLASKTAGLLPSKKLAYLEVEPHSLGSSSLGKTQKAVTELFGQTIAEHAQTGPTFVLLDEVETLIVDRSKLSMEANPIDVHRATDAALVQLDYRGLAKAFPKVEELSHHRELVDVAEACCGLDGRQIRKMVASACTFHRETAADPNRLKTADLLRAAEKAVKERKGKAKSCQS